MTEPIRILHVLGRTDIGGAESLVMSIYRNIDRSKVQFDFAIHTNDRCDFDDEIESLGGKIFAFPKFKGYNFITYRKSWKKFFEDHPEYKILHSHLRSYASIYLPIANKYGLKTIIHSHSTSNGIGIKSLIKKALQLPLSKQADYLFSCSTESGKWLFGDDVILKDNFYIFNNSIDVEIYRYNEEVRNSYRKSLKIENKTVFGHVGRLSAPKNHMFLLDIFKNISKINSDVILILVGDGELREDIEKRIIDLNLYDKVIMLGSRNDISKILQAVDVFLFPSLWEGLPVSVVEAQAAGLPCLVSDKVTREVDLTSCIRYIPIDQGIDIWVNEAIKINKIRNNDAADMIIEAGYDITKSSKWLTDFYRGIISD